MYAYSPEKLQRKTFIYVEIAKRLQLYEPNVTSIEHFGREKE